VIVVVIVLLLFIIYTINLPVVRPQSCRVIYYFDTPTLGRRHQLFGRVTYLSCNRVLYVLRKKKTSHQIRKIIIKKKFKSYLPQTSRHGYPRVVAHFSVYPPFIYEFQQKAPSVLDRT
jgi:hypothetical protein